MGLTGFDKLTPFFYAQTKETKGNKSTENQ